MKRQAFICGALLVAATLSCTREQDFATSEKMVFQATWADNSDTRTAIQPDGTSVWWSPNEEISIFHGNSYGKFTSTNTTPQATATFEGTFSGYDGRSVAEYWAVYPYDSDNDYYNGRLYLYVKSTQQGKEGTFADKAFPAVGVSDSHSIAFYHVCGGARFVVANEGIESVTFESLGGEPLAGYVTVSFEEGRPVAQPLSYNSLTAVTVIAPEGGFVPGKYYFAAFLPGTLSQGLNVTYSKSDGTFAEIALDKPITVRRARFGTIDRKDEGLTFKGYEVTAPTAVDLGLSVKWASFNIGATKPTEDGYFYAWGETEPKKVYDFTTYQWGDHDRKLTKYNFDADLGTVDDKIQLDEDDDVAHVKLGGKWRLPTRSELSELEETQNDSDYKWSFKSVDGVDGIEVVYLPNGNSIFFPASGLKSGTTSYAENNVRIWSSSLIETNPVYASAFSIYASESYYWGNIVAGTREVGMAVRPVYGDLPPAIPVESIILERQHVTLLPDVSFKMGTAVLPQNATNKVLRWSSDNESVATVNANGYVFGVSPGTATITVASLDGSTSVTCQVTVKTPETTITTPTAVDLGLSVKWASFNIGATKPEESGNYYAWGETESKTSFDYDTYKWYDESSGFYTKYNFDSSYGPVDNKFQLDAEDDVARVKLGGKWRMPTVNEMQELFNTRYDGGYQWQYKSINGIPGYEIVCLANGNNIFLPFAGDVYYDELSNSADYWTTSLSDDGAYSAMYGSISAYDSFGPDTRYYSSVNYTSRVAGLPVRPVYGDLNIVSVESVSLNRTGLDLPVGASLYLSATVLPENASTKKITWTSSDESVVTVSPSGEISALAPGSAVITVTAADGGLTATCRIIVKDPDAAFATPAAIDLGLSIKWASFNVGATKPTENGFYYAWGETEPKSTYDEGNYRWCDGDMDLLTKYNFDSAHGLVDNKSKLEDADDVAHVKLGGKWRMPTYEEIEELRNTEDNSNYQWTWKMLEDGCYGLEIVYLVNGNKIFLPASGGISTYGSLYDLDEYGVYWASSCPNNYLELGQCFNFYDYSGYFGAHVGTNSRASGHSVRPVYGDPPASIPAESISLDRERVVITQNLLIELNATILPENMTDITVWTSSDPAVATVNTSGRVTAVAPGTATITIQTVDGKKKASCQVTVQASATTFATPTAVDLGLSVKWGSFNLGATAPDQTGNYYAWGETEPKPFHLDSYQWYYNESWSVGGYTKYCSDPEQGYDGFTDGKAQLDPEDDVVRVKLGGKWRMPTKDEFQELKERCTWTWAVQNGLGGYQVKGPNGKSIFLPAAGYVNSKYLYNYDYKGYYYTSQLWEETVFMAYALEFGSWGDGTFYYYVSDEFRQNAATIRPVCD